MENKKTTTTKQNRKKKKAKSLEDDCERYQNRTFFLASLVSVWISLFSYVSLTLSVFSFQQWKRQCCSIDKDGYGSQYQPAAISSNHSRKHNGRAVEKIPSGLLVHCNTRFRSTPRDRLINPFLFQLFFFQPAIITNLFTTALNFDAVTNFDAIALSFVVL